MRPLARFDSQALRAPSLLSRPEDWPAPAQADLRIWDSLHRWCFDGSGIGEDAAARPRKPAPLTVACLWGCNDLARARLVEALCQDLDGSVRMAACANGLARMQLRLATKLIEHLPWRKRKATDPWDCGYIDFAPQRMAALRRFTPRRTTLMATVRTPASAVRMLADALLPQAQRFKLPVRLLICPDDEDEESQIQSALDIFRKAAVPVAILHFEGDAGG